MAGPLETLQTTAARVPWLQDDTSREYQATQGAEHDSTVDRARTAVKMRWTSGALMTQVAARVGATLDSTAGDTERLRRIGAGFALPRGYGMTDAEYEAYLDEAWDTWSRGGTVAAIVDAIHAFGIPDIEVVEEWEPGGSAGGPFEWRFRVIVGPDFGALGWTAPVLTAEGFTLPFTLGLTPPGGVSDATTQRQLDELVTLVRRWKPAWATSVDIVFRFQSRPAEAVLLPEGLALPFTLTEAADAMPVAVPVLGGEGASPSGPSGGPLTFPFELGIHYPRAAAV